MKYIAGAIIALAVAIANAATPSDCPPWATASKNLKLHGYKITKLSDAGVRRSLSYLAARTSNPGAVKAPPALIGYYAQTRFYQFAQDGHAVGGIPADRATLVLTDTRGECRAHMSGTIEQINGILDGSAERLSGSFAQ